MFSMNAAGAILIALTNVPEVCMWVESQNGIYGRTKNPYDTRRSVGGSSGGEGALISAAGSLVSDSVSVQEKQSESYPREVEVAFRLESGAISAVALGFLRFRTASLE